MKEETQETAIVPTTKTTAELIPGQTARADRKVLCRKHYAETAGTHLKQAFSGMAPGETGDHRRAARWIYATHLFDQGKAPGTISIVVSTVKWLLRHRNNGTSVDLPITSATLSGIRREGRGRGRGQRNGLTWREVEKICAVQEADGTLRGLRNSAISACYVRRAAPYLGSDRTSHRRPRGQYATGSVLQNGSGGSG